ncbi:cation:proton antiporter [Corynebacterium choanae]|nr:cation:proton antiporter [Corynebacterium choanae]
MNDTMILAAGAIEADVIVSLMWITIAALASPLLSFVTGKRIPGVVFMLVLGVIIGPEVLDLAEMNASIGLLRDLGLGMLFLLAGWEIEPDKMRGRFGTSSLLTWVISLVAAFATSVAVYGPDELLRSVVLAIAVSSTAMGTLLPVIKNAGRDGTAVGKGVLVHGAIGELGPVFAMTLLLSTRATWMTLIILLLFQAGALLVAFVPRTVSRLVPWVGRAVRDGASHTSQTVMRAVIVLLTTLMAMAAVFELDVVLGAFAAGIILRALVPARARKTTEARLDVMGYGFFIPVFFITSGMSIKLDAVFDYLWAPFVGIILIGIARGLPIFLMEKFTNTGSGLQSTRDKLELALYSATGLPIIVAVTDIAVSRNLLNETQASLLVCSGVGTVLLFPLLAAVVHDRFPGDDDAQDCPVETEKQAQQDHVSYKQEVVREKIAETVKKIDASQTPRQRPKSTTVTDDEITLDKD